MSTPVLVVGAGQIGTFAAGSLERRGGRVLAGDASPAPGFFSRFSGARDATLIELDALDRESVARAIDDHGAEVVVVTAGLVGQACAENPELAWSVNVEGAASIGEAALAANARRLVFVSTLGVYGRPDTDLIDESYAISPRSEYGRTKAAAEERLAPLRERGLDVRVLRPCGVYGPLRLGGGSHSARLIEAALITATRQGRVALTSGTGTSEQYLYARDLADAIAEVALFEQPLEEQVFNVAPVESTSAADLRAALLQVLPEVEVEIRVDDAADDVGSMPPLDAGRIRDALGFEPRFSLEDGIAAYAREARFVR